MRNFFFHLNRANSCVLVSIVKVGWRISIHRDLMNIKDLNIFTFPYAILWLKIKSLHISSKLYYLLVQFDASDQEASIKYCHCYCKSGSFCKTINRINFVERKDVFSKKKATLTFFGNLLSIFIYIFDIFRLHMRTKFCQMVYLTDLNKICLTKKYITETFFCFDEIHCYFFFLYILRLMMIRMVSSCILDLLICKLVLLVGF